jgi:hypothetical protein
MKDVTSRPRGAMRPSLDRVHPREWEGAGNAGCALHPRSRVQDAQGNAHTSIQVQRKHSGIPCAMALRLMPCSPRRRIRLVTVVGGCCGCSTRSGLSATADLAPATGVRTTRFCRTLKRRSSCAPAIAHEVQPALRPHLRADALASTTSHPEFVTTRDRPSCRNGMAGDKPLIWGLREAKFCPSCQSAATRRAIAGWPIPLGRRVCHVLSQSRRVRRDL